MNVGSGGLDGAEVVAMGALGEVPELGELDADIEGLGDCEYAVPDGYVLRDPVPEGADDCVEPDG